MRIRSDRINRLKEYAHVPIEICSERALLVTQYYKAVSDRPLPSVIKRAEALRHVLKNMSIYILPGELIVGNFASKPRGAPLFPEYSAECIEREIDSYDKREVDAYRISESTKSILRNEVCPFWKGKSVPAAALELIPKDIQNTAMRRRVGYSVNGLFGGHGHVGANFDKLLRRGLRAIGEEAEQKLALLDLTCPEDFEKASFYKAVKISCDAVIDFAQRYSALAREMSLRETDRRRKQELEKIAQCCEKVPAGPANSFWEALQSVYFWQLVIWLQQGLGGCSLGRFDQYLYPFLVKDLQEGLKPETAQELLECFLIKQHDIVHVYDKESAEYFAGQPAHKPITIGGQNASGEDATNELTFMVLDAELDLQLPQPELVLRIHKNTPIELWQKAFEVIRTGVGKPKLMNDEVVIPNMLSWGVSLEDARNYDNVGCVEPTVSSKSFIWSNMGVISLAKCLELALNDGIDRLTGERIGPSTGDPSLFKSIEDVMEAYRKQVRYFVRLTMVQNNAIQKAHREMFPSPAISALIDGCLEKGLDILWGGAHYNGSGTLTCGIGTVGDSLAAIKKMVFEERRVSMTDLISALDSNFVGWEHVQKILLESPRYGNDDDYVDKYVRWAVDVYIEEVTKFRDPRGGPYLPGVFALTSNVAQGKLVGATPDGRKAGEPVSDNASPVQGKELSGPTATFKSVAKLDPITATGGILLNMKLNPQLLRTAEDRRKIISLVQAYFQLGGFHVQFNVIDSETLRKAQRDPDAYRDLVVRVSGYSAYFVDLSRELQDDIIERTEHLTW